MTKKIKIKIEIKISQMEDETEPDFHFKVGVRDDDELALHHRPRLYNLKSNRNWEFLKQFNTELKLETFIVTYTHNMIPTYGHQESKCSNHDTGITKLMGTTSAHPQNV